jgi:hypothetical protein
MDFAQNWRDYGLIFAIVVGSLPYLGKLWLLLLSMIKRRHNRLEKQAEEELETQRQRTKEEAEAQRQREKDWTLELKGLLVDYRDQRYLAVKRAEKAEAQLAALQQKSLDRTDQQTAQYVDIVQRSERRDAAVVEVQRDLADLVRRLLARLERLEQQGRQGEQMWQVKRELPTSTK